MPNWKKVITSGSDATLNNLEIKPKPAGTTTTHGANLEITPSGSATQFGLLITGSTGNGTPFAMIQTPVGGGGTGEFIYGKGISGENSFRIRQGAGGSGAFLLYTSQSHGTQHIAHNFTDPLQGGDSYINYSQDTRSDAYFGIGTNAPATHLHVSGNISASGTIIGQSDLRVGTGTVFIKASGDITASGNISASGGGHVFGGSGPASFNVEGAVTASGEISASGTNHTLGGLRIIDSTATGSLYLSGSLEFSPNQVKPATSSSRIYNHKNDYMGDRLEFNGVPFGGTHYEQIHSNFIDDLNTGKVYMPIRDVFEQSIGYDDNIHRLATCSGSLVSLAFRLGNIGTSGGTLSFTLEKAPPSSLTGFTTVATETFVVGSGDKDYHTCFVRFDADATVAPGEIYAVAVQADADIGGNTYYSANMVWAWDYTSLPAHGTEIG